MTFKKQITYRLKLLFTLALIFLPLYSVFSQQNYQDYDSLYQPIIGYSGHAKFSFTTDKDENKVKEGPFYFESKQIDTICGNALNIIIWRGNYEDNEKTGQWDYWDTANDVELVDINEAFKVFYKLISVKTHTQGHFLEGKPEGEWHINSDIYKNGVKSGNVQSTQVSIRGQKFSGMVEIYSTGDSTQHYSIVGEAQGGLMVGDWTFSYQEGKDHIEEVRHFQSGFLSSLTKVNKETRDTLVKIQYPLGDPVLSYLSGEESDYSAANIPLSLTYSEGYPRNSSYIVEQTTGNKLLERTLSELFKFEPDFIAENGLPIGTNRMIYPVSSKEKRLLKIWPELEFSFREKVAALNELKLTNFKYGENDTLKLMHEWVNRQNFIIEYIKPWNNIFSLNEIEFYNREGILYEYAYDLLSADTFNIDDKTHIIAYNVPEKTAESLLPYVTENFTKRIKVADSLYMLYESMLTKLNLEDDIKALTDSISEKKGTLDALYTNSKAEHARSLKAALLQSIDQKFLDKWFREQYSSFLDPSGSATARKEQGHFLLHNLNLLQDAHHKVDQIFSRTGKIDSLYTEYVFDPYTFNDRFPRRIKKKLYQYVAEDLFKELVEEALVADSIPELNEKLNHLNSTHGRLIFLADKDTRKIERQLKQKMSTEEKLELLKIE